MMPPDPPSSSLPDDLAGHPDLDTLADLDAGLLDSPLATRVGRHAASCPRCSATLAAFATVRVDLRSLPPPMLPPAVAARLDDTLAQLRAGQTTARVPPMSTANSHQPHSPGSSGPALGGPASLSTRVGAGAAAGPGAPVVDLATAAEQRRARGRRLVGQVAACLVVAAALVGVGTAVLQHTDDSGTVAQGNALPGGQTSSGRGHGVSPKDDTAGGAGAGQPTPESAPPKIPSYTETTLLSAIPLIAARSAVDIITSAGLEGPAGPMANAARRASCTDSIPGSDGIPVAVQRVLFESRSGYVFLFAGTDGSRTVVVVETDCGITPVPQVLFRHRL
jgi:hypothetical protein